MKGIVMLLFTLLYGAIYAIVFIIYNSYLFVKEIQEKKG